jgi:hypothetical protein|tara:strand:+ start:334 stop:447 length:114 start_codon:yes stop_codon:yes gene_type:complete
VEELVLLVDQLLQQIVVVAVEVLVVNVLEALMVAQVL